MKTLKWITMTVMMAMLITGVVGGSFADVAADSNTLTIEQFVLERSGSTLCQAGSGMLLPVTVADLTMQKVEVQSQLSITDTEENTVNVSFNAQMYTDENVLDRIAVVTNTGNHVGYVRTWFAFEMGDLTEEEFKASVVLNQNSTDWTWGSFEYGVKIEGQRYAVVCAQYKSSLEGGQTTAPGLLQILLTSGVSNDLVDRLDGDGDGSYAVLVCSQAVSAEGAWSQMSRPW